MRLIILLLLFVALRANAAIQILYATRVTQGNVGNRSTANAFCGTAICDSPVSLLTYSDDDVHNVPLGLSQGAALYCILALQLGTNGTYSMWSGEAIMSIIAIATNIGTSTNVLHWWAGYGTYGGVTGNNCQDWTSKSAADVGTQWPTGENVGCDNLFQVPCVCDFPSRRSLDEVKRDIGSRRALAGKTHAPTHKPTHKPTTGAPVTGAPSTRAPTPMPTDHAVQYALLTVRASDYQARADFDVFAAGLMDEGNTKTTTIANAAAEQALADAFTAEAYALLHP